MKYILKVLVGLNVIGSLFCTIELKGGFESEAAEQWEQEADALEKRQKDQISKMNLVQIYKQQIAMLKKKQPTPAINQTICTLENTIAQLENRYKDIKNCSSPAATSGNKLIPQAIQH